jgi:hypothetical protein
MAPRTTIEEFEGVPQTASPVPGCPVSHSSSNGHDSESATQTPKSVALSSIPTPTSSHRALVNLLGNGFLRRGQTGLINGPTGIGKSVLVIQLAVTLAVGRPLFGLRPERALRVLIVQAENDDDDVAEMRDGVLKGLQLTTAESALYDDNVRIVRLFSSGRTWLADLNAVVLADRPDLLIVDPLFAFAGVDLAKDQPGLSEFLRGLLLPFSIKHNLGVILIHHTNKPPSNTKDRGTWQAGDFAYAGSGHNELANFSRFVGVIRSLGSRVVFELRIGKRWQRAGLVDAQGDPVDRLLIKHAHHGIHWETASQKDLEDTIEKSSGSPAPAKTEWSAELDKLAKAIFAATKSGKAALADVAKRLRTSEKTVRRRFTEIEGKRLLRVGEDQFLLHNSNITVIEEEKQAEVDLVS